VLYSGNHVPAPQTVATTGILIADGAGGAVHSFVSNMLGTLSGPTTAPYTYTVASDGTLELFTGPNLVGRGGISADGECAVIGSVRAGAFAGILVLQRRAGVHDDTRLTGFYHLVVAAAFPTTGSSSSGVATVGFDGGGNAIGGPATSNTMGSITSGTFGDSTYSVIADGSSVLELPGAALEGGVAVDGALALWAGSTDASAPTSITFAVREATSAGLGTFQGAYWIVVFERDPIGAEFRSLTGTATSSGTGSVSFVGTSNTEGTIAAEPASATTYTVTPNGRLTVAAGGSNFAGGVTGDGRFAVLGGGTTGGSWPSLVVFCRK
jgi:hypothetical protein